MSHSHWLISLPLVLKAWLCDRRISSFGWDMSIYMVPLALSMAVIRLVDIRTFTEGDAFFACFVLLLGYGWSIIGFTYVASFLCECLLFCSNFAILFFARLRKSESELSVGS